MEIPDQLVDLALDKVREMTDYQRQMAIAGDATCKSIDDFTWIVATYLHKEVAVLELTDVMAEDSTIRGKVYRYPRTYEIVLLAGLNYCWKRFVQCKELFQVVLDDDLFHNANLAKQVDEMAAEMMDMASAKPSMSIIAESLAEIACLEFMFPYSDRVRILEEHQGGKEIDVAAIAERYKIPKLWVELSLLSGNMNFFHYHYERRKRERGE